MRDNEGTDDGGGGGFQQIAKRSVEIARRRSETLSLCGKKRSS